jgi:hypothetical protein
MLFETELQISDQKIQFLADGEKKKEKEDWDERNPKKSGQQQEPGSERKVGNHHNGNNKKEDGTEHSRIPKGPCPQKGSYT